ncbi:MAG: AAA family ATPase [Verrucomicrobia bacterium]|nr:AAA family ATPase [Verrucomicrobiota bacterium]
MKKAVFIAATGQHVGKTTLSLGILSGLKKRYGSVGFLKPVGQELVRTDDGSEVDKDAVLFKDHFGLTSSYTTLSPMHCPSGFTRDFLDEKVGQQSLLEQITHSWEKLKSIHDFMLVEGTGHVGVGSLFDLNNARVAKLLGIEVVIIATGGIGSAFDELALNIEMCKSHNVAVKGIILNKVLDDKREMILEYFPKALERWKIPLIGCVPFRPLLSRPSMKDFSNLFKSPFLSGEEHAFRHFEEIRLVAGALDSYVEEMKKNQLIITPACREDIIIATIGKHLRERQARRDWSTGLILTGHTPPRDEIKKRMINLDLPIIYAPLCSFDVMKKVSTFNAKILREDTEKVQDAITTVEKNINFDLLCNG